MRNLTDSLIAWISALTGGDHIDRTRLLRNAYGLLGDGMGHEWDANPEYARAIIELVGETLGLSLDDRQAVVTLIATEGRP